GTTNGYDERIARTVWLRPCCTAAWLYYRLALTTQRAIGRIVCRDVQCQQSAPRHAEIDISPAAIHQGASSNDNSAGPGNCVHSLAGGAAGRNHVFDHQDLFAGRYREAAPERHNSGFALGE